MEKRREELMELNSYIEGIDNKLTMILQSLQWDKKHFLQNPVLVTCRYDSNHKVPPDKTEEHEKECFLRQNGYSKDDRYTRLRKDELLPDPLDLESNTLVKFSKEDIKQIIENASRSDCLFKKGVGCHEAEPLSLERLQVSYTADERRAIHDAVVSAVPSCHDLNDLALLSGAHDKSSKVILSRQEILSELRNMRRRRTKYRVAAKSRNYSDVLRDVIRTQMEHYNDGISETEPDDTVNKDTNQRDKNNISNDSRSAGKEYRSRHDGKIVPQPIKIKIERKDSTDRNRDYSKERSDRAYRHEIGSKDRRDRGSDNRGPEDRSRERRYDDDLERVQKYGEHSRKRTHDNETRGRRYYYEGNENNAYRTDSKCRSNKGSKRSHRDKDEDTEYQMKKEPELEDELNNLHKHKSRERKYDEKGDKSHRHKDKKERRRDRDRSKERRRERHEERPSERIHIKQEREDSVTRGVMINYVKEKADRDRKGKSKRHDRSNRDANYDSHCLGIQQENYDRYYDGRSEEIYDPNKKIKVEK